MSSWHVRIFGVLDVTCLLILFIQLPSAPRTVFRGVKLKILLTLLLQFNVSISRKHTNSIIATLKQQKKSNTKLRLHTIQFCRQGGCPPPPPKTVIEQITFALEVHKNIIKKMLICLCVHRYIYIQSGCMGRTEDRTFCWPYDQDMAENIVIRIANSWANEKPWITTLLANNQITTATI